MEWITTTAKTLPEAIDLALDNLGVDEAEAEIVIKEEPKQGFFGRLKGIARVEARVRPKPARNKRDSGRGRTNQRRNKPRSNQRRENNSSAPAKSDTRKQNSKNFAKNNSDQTKTEKGRKMNRDEQELDTPLEDVVAHLKEYLVNLSSAFGYDDGVTVTGSEEEGITATIEGQHGLLIGPKGRTLNAIQELARVSTQRAKPSNYRIYVDVGGYREKRKKALVDFARKAAQKAKSEESEVVLDPMSSSDRKVIHDALTAEEGVETRSAGMEPRRRVVVVPLEPAYSGDK